MNESKQLAAYTYSRPWAWLSDRWLDIYRPAFGQTFGVHGRWHKLGARALWLLFLPVFVPATLLYRGLNDLIVGALGRARIPELPKKPERLSGAEYAELYQIFGCALLEAYRPEFTAEDEAAVVGRTAGIQMFVVEERLRRIGVPEGQIGGWMEVMRRRVASACAECPGHCCTAFVAVDSEDFRRMPSGLSACRRLQPDGTCGKYEDRSAACKNFVCNHAAYTGRAPTWEQYSSGFFADEYAGCVREKAHRDMVKVYRAHPDAIDEFLRICGRLECTDSNTAHPFARYIALELQALQEQARAAAHA